jgi:phosphomannomutase
MVTFTFTNGCVATLRTSGTEPKIKYYVEMHGADPVLTATILEDITKVMKCEYSSKLNGD